MNAESIACKFSLLILCGNFLPSVALISGGVISKSDPIWNYGLLRWRRVYDVALDTKDGLGGFEVCPSRTSAAADLPSRLKSNLKRGAGALKTPVP